MSRSPCPTLRRRPVDDRFPRQRGCGRISLGRRIKGWEGWEVTWCRKRRDAAVGWSWERFDACFSSISSSYYESCNSKAVWNTINNDNCIKIIRRVLKAIVLSSSPVGQLSPWQVVAWPRWRRAKVRKTSRAILRKRIWDEQWAFLKKQILDDDHVNSDSFWSVLDQVLLTIFWL